MSSPLLSSIAGAPPVTAKAAVVDHLARMFGTRRGTMLGAPEYGIDDVAHLFHEMPAGVELIQSQLENAMRLFEPRLARARVVRLEPEELELTVKFEIRASLVVDGHVVPVRFTATVDPSKRSVSI